MRTDERARSARQRQAGRLTPLAERLFRVLTDGAPRLRFNIRNGPQLRDELSRRPILSSYTDSWRAARDVDPDGTQRDRLANALVLEQHLLGRYDVAIQAPSWSSLVVLDIDRPELGDAAGDPLAELQADARRDQVLAAVWRAYRFDANRQPVILRTPGGGYHLYLPHCRDAARKPDQHQWPVAWSRQRHEHHLDRHRVGLKPGVLELYPTGVPLRAPCGRGTALLVPRTPDDPDDLGLELVHAEWVEHRDPRTGARSTVLRRTDVAGYVADFLARLEAGRRPLEAWLEPEPERPAWGERYGPFGDREVDAARPGAPSSYQHKVDVPGRGGAGRPRLSAAGAAPRDLDPGSLPSLSSPAGARSELREGDGSPGGQPFPGIGRAPGGTASGGQQAPGVEHDPPSGGAEVTSPRGSRRTGWLLHGRDFRLRIARLQAFGLEESGQRHDAALKLAYHYHVVCGLDEDATIREIAAWLGQHRHTSATRARKEAAFRDDTLREARHYVEVHLRRGQPGPGGGSTPGAGPARTRRTAALSPADERMLERISEVARPAARAILGLVGSYADAEGRVPHPVALSAATLERLAGQRRLAGPDGQRRRATVVALEELQALGVLAVHVDYSVGRHGRLYTCWYRFGSGELPPRDPEIGVILGTRVVAEGALAAVAGGVGEPPRARFVSLRTGLVEAISRAESWWIRMYERRAFTPAEFFAADERHVLPGPFRDRRPKAGSAGPDPEVPSPPPTEPSPDGDLPEASPPLPAPDRGDPPGAAPPAPGDRAALPAASPASRPPQRRPGDTDEIHDLRRVIAEAEARGDHEAARRALVELWARIRAAASGRGPPE